MQVSPSTLFLPTWRQRFLMSRIYDDVEGKLKKINNPGRQAEAPVHPVLTHSASSASIDVHVAFSLRETINAGRSRFHPSPTDYVEG
jgi:hypothetical protein